MHEGTLAYIITNDSPDLKNHIANLLFELYYKILKKSTSGRIYVIYLMN